IDAGVSARSIRRRIEAGAWDRPAPGVVRMWDVPGGDQEVLAAIAFGPGGTLASHQTAARLHDIGGFDEPPRPHVTVPRGYRYLDHDVAVIHTTTRRVREPVTIGEILTTPVPRTLRDLAASRDVSRRLLHRSVRDVLRDGLATPEEVLVEAEPRGPGRRRLREAVELEMRVTGQRTESRLERAWADVLLEEGLTGFTTQHDVRDAGRSVRLDIAWPALKVAIEIDGARFHADALAAAADAERTRWLEARGWTVVRVTAADLRADRRHLALADIRAALATATTNSPS
ncbi:MAG: DUF559 domain-containing protein, partial [Ilumatobacteraceae bacterium]